MADFHQNGNIAQFHNLRCRPIEELVYELEAFAQTRKITLILPSLYSELEETALANIVEELSKVTYLHRIVIGLEGPTPMASPDHAEAAKIIDEKRTGGGSYPWMK